MTDAPQWPALSAPVSRPLAELVPYARNARIHSEAQVEQIAASMREFGVVWPALVDEHDEIIAGHGRVLGAARNGWSAYPVIVAKGWTQRQIKAYRLADNQLALNAAWDVKLLAAELGELPGLEALIGFAEGDLEALLRGEADGRPPPTEEEARRTLAERFGLPPFSVLNAREGWWQDRKRAWLALGIESELGRGENLLKFSETINEPDPIKREAKRKGKPKAATFMTGAERGGGNFNDQVVGKRKKAQAFRTDTGTKWDVQRSAKLNGSAAALKTDEGALTYGLPASAFGQPAQRDMRRERAKAKRAKKGGN